MTGQQRNGPPDSEVPAPQGEPAPTTTPTVDDPKTTCRTGRCAYGVPCTCDWYQARGWRCATPARHPRPRRRPSTGLRAAGLRDGHRRGVAYACRELWAYLDGDGRSAAAALVAQAEAAVDE
jgi:hypothetical protein